MNDGHPIFFGNFRIVRGKVEEFDNFQIVFDRGSCFSSADTVFDDYLSDLRKRGYEKQRRK